MDMMDPLPSACLSPSPLVDSANPLVQAFAREHATGGNARERAVALYYAVRDGIRYDPYRVDLRPQGMRASAVIASGHGWCVPKATLLAAVCRAAGIPSRLGFADVRNHLNSAALLELMGTDLFVFHGWSAVYVDGQWRKGSPAFNSELCRRFGVEPLEFDGSQDALLHAADGAGRRHMEYVRERGMFVDLPFDELMATLLHTYGPAMVRGSDTPRPQDPRFRA